MLKLRVPPLFLFLALVRLGGATPTPFWYFCAGPDQQNCTASGDSTLCYFNCHVKFDIPPSGVSLGLGPWGVVCLVFYLSRHGLAHFFNEPLGPPLHRPDPKRHRKLVSPFCPTFQINLAPLTFPDQSCPTGTTAVSQWTRLGYERFQSFVAANDYTFTLEYVNNPNSFPEKSRWHYFDCVAESEVQPDTLQTGFNYSDPLTCLTCGQTHGHFF